MSKQENKLVPELRFPEFRKDEEWKIDKVENLILTITPPKKLPSSDYLQSGKFPIIDQSKNFYCGWTNDETSVITTNLPLIIFGDHTCILKLATKPFAQGADGIKIFKPKNKQRISTKFLFQYLKYNEVKLEDYKRHFSILKEKKVLFPIIETGEQQKIASCLSSLDDVIEAHSDKLEYLKQYKKGLLQNLFPQEGETVPKLRFKEFSEALIKFGFAELGDIKIGLTHKPDYINEGIPFLSSKNISGGYIDFLNVQYISKEKFESMPESTKPKIGDILFTRVGSNLGNPIILDINIEFGIFVSLGFFRVNKKAYNYYIKYWMETDLFWKQVTQKVGGGAKDNLNSTWLKEFELYLPSIQEQQKIASFLSSIDDLINAESNKITQLKAHKKGLLQGLFPKIES